MAETTSPDGGADTLAPSQHAPAPTLTQAAEPEEAIILGDVGDERIRPFSLLQPDILSAAPAGCSLRGVGAAGRAGERSS